MPDFTEELKKLPDKPGIYIMRGASDEVLYVGKAKILKNRVRQYFQGNRDRGAKIERMISQIVRFETIVTDSEMEALILENNLIKEHRPRYNTLLTDDKTYPFLKITIDEAFPRVRLARKMGHDKAKYFGPYPSSYALKETMDLLRKIYHIRDCNRKLPQDIGKARPCLNYHIHQCDAPCQGFISEEDYHKSVEEVLKFLDGKYDTVLKDLEKRMNDCSEALEFEKAAELRDLRNNVLRIVEKQKITDTSGENRDVIGFASDEEDAVIQMFFIRGGRLIGRDRFYLKVNTENSNGEILIAFLKQFYAGSAYIPAEILLPFVPDEIDDAEKEEISVVEEWLSKIQGRKVRLHMPQKGLKEKLLRLATENAALILKNDREKMKREEGKTIGAVKELAEILGLSKLVRIESYDISNTGGFISVGSMVVYEKGKPKPGDYRKFRIKSVEGPNDVASLREVIFRRFSHGIKERNSFGENINSVSGGADYADNVHNVGSDSNAGSFNIFPDLILMDGGKGQVNAARQVLDELDISLPICGMVKDDKHRTRGLYFNDVELPIDKHSECFKLLTRIQDETHRFAITYHRSLRGKNQVKSVLDDIPGIGSKRRIALMKHFQGIEELKAATVEELSQIPSMDARSSKAVKDYFSNSVVANITPK
ncbi:MAG: excinuclease ABC subunit UvrC [Lachnospiraceae bacterium]|jgi:excinuclease ABC subunit C|nr:excinuclease ABC subunit UvrC [Lachnospiraceae bacterium]